MLKIITYTSSLIVLGVLMVFVTNGVALETDTNEQRRGEDQNACSEETCYLDLSSIKVEATFMNKTVVCNESISFWTHVKMECKKEFIPESQSNNTGIDNVCLDTGNWLNPVPICIKECGAVYTSPPFLPDYENNLVHLYHPWQAGIFRTVKNGEIRLFCSGTLITRTAVLTAASCVDQLSSTVIKVIVGMKYHHIYNVSDPTPKFYDVGSKILPDEYSQNILTGGIHDLAILELKEPVKSNSYINPICIDFTNQYTIPSSSLGEVITQERYSDKTSRKLKKTNFLLKNRKECLKFINDTEMGNIFTEDKFCAIPDKINVNDWNGLNGSGMTFHFNQYYVSGLVTSEIHNQVILFTNITHPYNLRFISNALQKISEKQKLNG